MQVSPYLSFKGDCEAAFKFYEQNLGAKPGSIYRYGGTPLAKNVPADWDGKVMHGSLKLGDLLLLGGDVAPGEYQTPQGFSLSIGITGIAEAERIFSELAEGGNVLVPLEQTFWAARFGAVTDRFGIPWLINCEAPAELATE